MPHGLGGGQLRSDNIVVVEYLGDGATSEGLPCGAQLRRGLEGSVVFVCQNNQWAISTPVSGRTAAAAMACRHALAYGMPALRWTTAIIWRAGGMRDAKPTLAAATVESC